VIVPAEQIVDRSRPRLHLLCPLLGGRREAAALISWRMTGVSWRMNRRCLAVGP